MKIFIIAGEASGDYLGSELMKDLRELRSDIEFFGIGGSLMKKAGLNLLFGIEELSIMGLTEVIGKIFHIKKLIARTVQAICGYDPDVLITIDSSGFTHRVDKKIKKLKLRTKIIHYVAPQVWAWREWRAKGLNKFIDKLLVLFPHEPELFKRYGLDTVFVGHPIAKDSSFDRPGIRELVEFKNLYCRDTDTKKIVLLPGSRMAELDRLIPVLEEFTKMVIARYKKVIFFIPTIPILREEIEKRTAKWSYRPIILSGSLEKVKAYYCADIAIAASGTVTLELARVGLPFISIYKASPITALLLRFLLKTKYVCLVNILAEKSVVPELLQSECNAQNIFDHAVALLENTGHQTEEQKKLFHSVISRITASGGVSAAAEILKLSLKN